jgi:tetratricopeptide (TPR) repeat protein
MRLFPLIISLSLLIAFTSCRRNTAELPESHLGVVDFTAKGSPEAQSHFHKGLLLLHSFEYDDARQAFRQAQEADREMAMAFWGEAMTHNHPLWRQQDLEAGRESLQKLAPTAEARAEKADSELEKDLLAATEILYGEGPKVERDSLYAAYMKGLYEKHPGQHEVAAFYALSLLGAVPVGRDYESYGLGAQIAKSILAENPNHPGALHYLIHAYDDPSHAALAIQAANSYSQVAPDAAHALHMPSHIYVAMGMWDEVVASNIASYEASVKRMERMGLDHDARSYHAFAWLMYGQLQKGRKEEALQILEEMIRYTEELPSKPARSYLNSMQGNYLVETGEWDGPMTDIHVEVSDLNIVARAQRAFVLGMSAYAEKDEAALKNIITAMEDERQSAALQVSEKGAPMCSAAQTRQLPNQQDLDQARVMELELRSLYAQLTEKPEMAEKLLAEATQLENQIDYSYGPPDVVYPSFEMYGEWLLEQGRAEAALEQFRMSLARGPKRVKALNGVLEAARNLQNQSLIEETTAILNEIGEQAL